MFLVHTGYMQARRAETGPIGRVRAYEFNSAEPPTLRLSRTLYGVECGNVLWALLVKCAYRRLESTEWVPRYSVALEALHKQKVEATVCAVVKS